MEKNLTKSTEDQIWLLEEQIAEIITKLDTLSGQKAVLEQKRREEEWKQIYVEIRKSGASIHEIRMLVTT